MDAKDVPRRHLIQESTTGIIFLGTPHGGSNLANILRRISFCIDGPKNLLNVLFVGSVSLEKLTARFKNYYFGMALRTYIPVSY